MGIFNQQIKTTQNYSENKQNPIHTTEIRVWLDQNCINKSNSWSDNRETELPVEEMRINKLRKWICNNSTRDFKATFEYALNDDSFANKPLILWMPVANLSRIFHAVQN